MTPRREILKAMGLAGAGLTLELHAAAAIHKHVEQKAAEPSGPWKPEFFREQEARMVYRLTDLILPSEGPSTPESPNSCRSPQTLR